MTEKKGDSKEGRVQKSWWLTQEASDFVDAYAAQTGFNKQDAASALLIRQIQPVAAGEQPQSVMINPEGFQASEALKTTLSSVAFTLSCITDNVQSVREDLDSETFKSLSVKYSAIQKATAEFAEISETILQSARAMDLGVRAVKSFVADLSTQQEKTKEILSMTTSINEAADNLPNQLAHVLSEFETKFKNSASAAALDVQKNYQNHESALKKKWRTLYFTTTGLLLLLFIQSQYQLWELRSAIHQSVSTAAENAETAKALAETAKEQTAAIARIGAAAEKTANRVVQQNDEYRQAHIEYRTLIKKLQKQ